MTVNQTLAIDSATEERLRLPYTAHSTIWRSVGLHKNQVHMTIFSRHQFNQGRNQGYQNREPGYRHGRIVGQYKLLDHQISSFRRLQRSPNRHQFRANMIPFSTVCTSKGSTKLPPPNVASLTKVYRFEAKV